MPTYCYSTIGDLKKTFDRIFPAGKAPERLLIERTSDGWDIYAERDRCAELSGTTISVKSGSSIQPPSGPWPMSPCFASGVGASQAQELRDHFSKHGVKTEVTSDGDPIYTSAAHRKRALKCREMHDANSY